ncbi:MAG TPA: hypothetical protein VLD35_01145 [Caldimonas sp.]|nr:hypothetical protein [Caldimonas sp.]
MSASLHDLSPSSRPRRPLTWFAPVRAKTLVAAAALVLATSMTAPVLASPEQDALIFLDSQVLPKKAATCAARIAGYSARFDPAFRIWLGRNKDHVASGEAFLRADAERTKVPFEPDVQAIATSVTQQWAAAPLPTLQDHCEALLVQLREVE